MATFQELLQMILVLANALRSVVESEWFAKSIECICRHTRSTEHGKGRGGLARDLMNEIYDLLENVQLLLDYSELGILQDRVLNSYVNKKEPLSDGDLRKIESEMLQQVSWQYMLVWSELHKNHAIVDCSDKGRFPDWTEVKNDDETNNVFEALTQIIATLRVICGIASEISDILVEVGKYNVDVVSYQPSFEHVQEILRIRKRMYHSLCDSEIKTSKYCFDDKVIEAICEEGYTGRKPLQLLNYRVNYKPKSVFGQGPSMIFLLKKLGKVEVFVP